MPVDVPGPVEDRGGRGGRAGALGWLLRGLLLVFSVVSGA